MVLPWIPPDEITGVAIEECQYSQLHVRCYLSNWQKEQQCDLSKYIITLDFTYVAVLDARKENHSGGH